MSFKRIPVFNEKFKLTVFLLIVRKSIFFFLFVFVLAFIAGFLYLRYTPREYEASVVLQLNPSNNTNLLLNMDNKLQQEDDDLPHTIEQLRSKEFLKTVFKKLPLKIGYFREGTFLSEELYTGSPFNIQVDTIIEPLMNKPIYVDFKDKDTAILSYNNGNNDISYKLKTGVWQKIPAGTFKISIKNYQSISETKNNLKQNRLYFIVFDEKNLIKQNKDKLNVVVENQMAKTINISFRDKNPVKVSDVVNIIAEEFLKYDVERKKEGTASILKFIDKQSALVYKKLNYLGRQIQKFQKDNHISVEANSDMLPNMYLNRLNTLEDRILDLEYERSALQRVNNEIKNAKDINTYEIIGLLSGIESENLLLSVLDNLQDLLAQKQKMLNDVTANNMKIKLINTQIDQQKQKIVNLVNSILIRIDHEIVDTRDKINAYRTKLNLKGYDEIELSRLQRLYKVNEEYYNQLLEKKAEYMIYEAGYVSNDVILEKATIPRYPVSPIKIQIFIALFIVSLIIIIVYLILKYLFYNQIIAIDDILEYTDVPILGIIPLVKKSEDVSKLVIQDGNNSFVSEAFRSLRTNLNFFREINGKQLISVTSTVAGEGKTFIAINLAGIIAKLGKKVILLDLDLRKPRLHLSFGVENKKGISNILVNDATLDECINKSSNENLDFITTGPMPPNPSELVVSPEMDLMLEELKKIYDVVIIDTPPVGLVTDAFVNFKKADYPIYVLRANYSKKTFINNINHIRFEKNIENLSLVLNAYDMKNSKYGTSYGYGYGYGYGFGYSDNRTHRNNGRQKKWLFRK